MRKFILWMQQTVDGYVSGPNGEFDWPVVLPKMNAYFDQKARQLGGFSSRQRRSSPASC